MDNAGAIVFSGIVPHPPIMVAAVGGEAVLKVRASVAAMAELSSRVIESGAETLVLISPHAPLDATAFVAYTHEMVYGDFAKFRAPETKVEAELDSRLLGAIAAEARDKDYEVLDLEDYELDHGTTVPLYFLQQNGWCGRIIALGYSFLSDDDHLRFGNCIARAANRIGRPIAFLASGDLSHRLLPEAPAGYDSEAHLFDEEIVAALQSHNPNRIVEIDPQIRKRAGECGYRSMLVALGAIQGLPISSEVLHYEAPFGVGYLVAQLTNAGPSQKNINRADTSATHEPGELAEIARSAVQTYVTYNTQFKPEKDPVGLLAVRAGCFVSIKTGNGELRGCIGTIEPQRNTLADEIITNAISAATHDPRFAPVSEGELQDLRYSVDVLSVPEPTTLQDLDPLVYGVIVEDESGERRGLLLPDIPGIDSVAKQVEIATRKAGIRAGESIKLSRFRVERFREERL